MRPRTVPATRRRRRARSRSPSRQRGAWSPRDGVRVDAHVPPRRPGPMEPGPAAVRYDEAAVDVALAAVRGLRRPVGERLRRAIQVAHTTAVPMQHGTRRREAGAPARLPRRRPARCRPRDLLGARARLPAPGRACSTALPRRPAAAARLRRPAIVYRDAVYGQRALELDGRLLHDTAEQRDRDFERDLDAAVEGHDTVRLTWGQVFGRPCSTAAKVSATPRARRLAAGPAVRQRLRARRRRVDRWRSEATG